jgi:hypothetical protein
MEGGCKEHNSIIEQKFKHQSSRNENYEDDDKEIGALCFTRMGSQNAGTQRIQVAARSTKI